MSFSFKIVNLPIIQVQNNTLWVKYKLPMLYFNMHSKNTSIYELKWLSTSFHKQQAMQSSFYDCADTLRSREFAFYDWHVYLSKSKMAVVKSNELEFGWHLVSLYLFCCDIFLIDRDCEDKTGDWTPGMSYFCSSFTAAWFSRNGNSKIIWFLTPEIISVYNSFINTSLHCVKK